MATLIRDDEPIDRCPCHGAWRMASERGSLCPVLAAERQRLIINFALTEQQSAAPTRPGRGR
jgi:hypothetical protein